MKKINKIFLFILVSSFFLFPKDTYALGAGETRKLYMNFDIQVNGDLKVYEVAELNPTYNGRLRTLAYKNLKASQFNGSKESFNGSDIYNADGISDLVVSDVDMSQVNPLNLRNLNLGNRYMLTYNDETGNSGYYQSSNTSDGISLKIFNTSNTNRAFYLAYTYKNAAVVHDDVAEVAWNILGDSYADEIEELVVYVNLPRNDKSMRTWLRGPLDGYIERVDDKTAKITYHNLKAGNAISFRMMFDTSLVPFSTKFSEVDGKDNIMAVEQEAADAANAQRQRARLVQGLIKYGTIIWFVGIFILIILVIKDKKKREQCDFNMDYYRDFPGEYGPEVLEYLMKEQVTEISLSASLLNLIDKGAVTVEEDPKDKKNFIFTKVDEKDNILTKAETLLEHLIFEIVGKDNKVELNAIKNYGKSYSAANKFLTAFNKWQAEAISEGEKEEFYTSSPAIHKTTIGISFIGIILTVCAALLESDFLPAYFAVVFAIIIIIVLISFKYRSPKGVLQYKQWTAFKNFLKDFGTMDEKELPEIIIWEKYLVYATVLGCADKLERDMKTRIDQMNLDREMYNDPYYYGYYHRMFIYNSFGRGLRQSVQRSYSNSVSSRVANSSNSSGGGFGGGASMGGGSFGGGGGGGHF